MKKIKKMAFAFLCILTASFLFTGCTKTSTQEEAEAQAGIKAANLKSIETYTQNQFAQVMTNNTYETFEQYVQEQGQVFITYTYDNDFGNRWKAFVDKHGEVQKAAVDQTLKTDTGYTSRIILTGEDGNQMALTITYDKTSKPVSTAIADYSDDTKISLGSKLATAGTHTLIGMGTVFIMLIVLCLLISGFRLVGGIPKKKSEPAPSVKAAAPAAVPSAAIIKPEENPELAAVIAAAIAASEDKPAGGFVVRSIKRLDSNKWR